MWVSGIVFWLIVIGVVLIWFVEVFVVYYFFYYISFGIEGIWIGYLVVFIVSLIL